MFTAINWTNRSAKVHFKSKNFLHCKHSSSSTNTTTMFFSLELRHGTKVSLFVSLIFLIIIQPFCTQDKQESTSKQANNKQTEGME
jgi:hypothetical protein